MIIAYHAAAAGAGVKTVADLNIPSDATHAELQADHNTGGTGVRYTMDGETNPSGSAGFILKPGVEPKLFLIEDLRRIRFIRDGSTDTALFIHYVGRNE